MSKTFHTQSSPPGGDNVHINDTSETMIYAKQSTLVFLSDIVGEFSC